MFQLELHFVTQAKHDAVTRRAELRVKASVLRLLANYRVYSYSINSETSTSRFSDNKFYSELASHGAHAGACCYEMSLVRSDLLTMSQNTTGQCSVESMAFTKCFNAGRPPLDSQLGHGAAALAPL